MPRTKRVRQSRQSEKNSNEENVKPNKSKVVRDMINSYLKAMENEATIRRLAIEGSVNRLKLEINSKLEEERLESHSVLNKTMAEYKLQKTSELITLSEITSRNITVDTSKASSKRKTNCSSESDSILKSTARSNIKKAKTTRASRSMSRNKAALGISAYTTPIHNNISTASTFGIVTPKMKPNTPQVLLRRPKQGEVAISMQGSPLMVGSILSDQKANVNIPLQDGRVLSIQPQRGLRTSQIPDLDPETRRQIETLRDNLNKVCALTARH